MDFPEDGPMKRATIEELRVNFARQGLSVNEIVKVVRGNRYRYARVWIRLEQRQRDIYLGPVKPKTLRGILNAADVALLHQEVAFHEANRHVARVDLLRKILRAYDAEE